MLADCLTAFSSVPTDWVFPALKVGFASSPRQTVIYAGTTGGHTTDSSFQSPAASSGAGSWLSQHRTAYLASPCRHCPGFSVPALFFLPGPPTPPPQPAAADTCSHCPSIMWTQSRLPKGLHPALDFFDTLISHPVINHTHKTLLLTLLWQPELLFCLTCEELDPRKPLVFSGIAKRTVMPGGLSHVSRDHRTRHLLGQSNGTEGRSEGRKVHWRGAPNPGRAQAHARVQAQRIAGAPLKPWAHRAARGSPATQESQPRSPAALCSAGASAH